MAGRFLLDTNIVTALFKPEAVVEAAVRGHQTYLTSTIPGELYFGAENSNRRSENILAIDRFASGSRVLPCDQRTARVYGQIKLSLKLAGQPIPDNDIWIAAAALQHSLTLATRDRHFQAVKGLQTVLW